MQHPKLLDIEYAANLRVHLGAKIAAHFSKIAFPESHAVFFHENCTWKENL